MKHFKLFFALFAMLALNVGNAWAETVVLDQESLTTSKQAYVTTDYTHTATDGSEWVLNVYGIITTNPRHIQLGKASKNYIKTPNCSGNITNVSITFAKACSYYIAVWDLDGTKASSTVASQPAANSTINFAITGEHKQLQIISTRTTDGTSITTSNAAAYIASITVTYETSSGGETPDPTPSKLSTPANLKEASIAETSATLSWDAVANASNYSVTINGNTETVTTNSYSATGLTAGTEYTWSVVAKGDGTNYTDSDAAQHTFTTTATTPDPEPGTDGETATATLTFDANKANRTSYSTTQQVWAQNGVTFTNNKASSTSNIGDYGNPVRLYKSSEIVVECSKGNMTKIVFTANSESYATAMCTSLGNSLGTVTTDGNDVILTLSTPATATSAISLSGQVRLNSVTVTYETSGSGSTEPVVKTLQSIAVTDMTQIYQVGDAFSFDGKCTATYSVTKDGVEQAPQTATVTPTFVSTPDMTQVGTPTVTVTYTEGDVTKTAEYTITIEEAPTYNFTKIDMSEWGTGYDERVVTYEDATVTFASASKQSGTITDQPVTKGGDVSLVLTDGMNIATVKWVCTQWTTKAQTITLHYSKDGGNVYTSTEITSSDFTISSDNLPAGTNAVKITFSSTNQVGIKSCTITKVEAAAITQVPAPQFSLQGGAYDGAQSVELTCTMADATIHYTTDDTTPTTTSPVYSTAIQVTESMTIKAYAVKEGLEDSPMVEATYEISAPADVVLDFTTNTWLLPEGNANKATEKTDFTNGDYTVSIAAPTAYYFDSNNLFLGKKDAYIVLPVFNKPIVKIVCEGVSSGSGSVAFNVFVDDEAVSTQVTSCKVDQTFLIAEDKQIANVAHVIKVTNDNNLRIAKIKIYLGEAPAVEKPIIGGEEEFVASTEVSITCATPGARIYYTTDETTPTDASPEYTTPFELTETKTVKAIAYVDGQASAVAEMTFTKHDLVNVATAMAAAKDEIVYLKPFDVVYAVTGKEYVYIKDESGFGLIYDTDLANQLLNGDRVEGFVGKSSPYRSLPELKAHNTENMTITHGTAVEPTEFTTVPATSHVNQYVVFKNVTFDEDVVFNSSTATNATFKLNTNDVTLRNSFKFDVAFEADKTYDIYGAIATYQATESDPIEVQVYYLNSAEAGQEVVTYTVTYDANGASGNVPTDLANYAAGQQVTVAGQGEMTYENHMFTGWKYNGTIYQAGDKFNMPADDVTLVAQWEEVKTYDQGAWVLVTDAGDLAVNDDVIIAAANENHTLGKTQNNNNRGIGTIIKGSNVALFESNDVQILTLEEGNQSGTLALSTGKGYLYAASSSSNHLKTETTLSDNSSWTIAINEGLATIEAQGTNTHNLLQYNSTSKIFSCYSSAQQSVAIYEYKPNERVITFDVNGGEAYAHTYVATTGGTLTLPTDVPTHAAEGQLFSSWNDKEDGSGNTYDAGTTYPFAEHTTLYAQWTVADAYHVTYNITGASGTTPVDANHYYGGETVTLASQGDLINPGHIFAGWNVVDANNTEILVTENNTFIMPQSDVTATAKWVRQTNDTWVLVTETAQLVVGKKYVIACNTEDAVAGTINTSYMDKLDAAFSDDKQVIKALAPEAVVFTLGGTTGAWTFTNEAGKALGATAVKKMAWASGTTTWTLTFDANGVLTMTNTTDSYGALKYNRSDPRFTTYASGQKDIQLYILIPNQVVTGEKKTDNDVPQHSNVTVENGGDLFVEKSDTQYGDVYINNGGSVEVDDNAQLTVNNLYISTTMGATTSGQLNTAAEDIIVNGDVFIDITLGKNGDPSQWHAFTVPFPVDAMNGVYDLNDKKLTNEVNYAIMDYHGDLRANGQYGWKKYRGILVPGTFYLMTVDGERTTYRFKKVKDAELIAPATKELKAYTGTGDATKDHGWNGVGNPTLMHGKVDFDAQILDPEWYIYKTITVSSTAHFTVGTPFFIQAAADGTMTITAEPSAASLAPARRAAAAVENIKVMLGNSDYTDYLYVSASEDATNEYEIGKDLAKMIMTKTPSVPQIFALAYDTRLCMIDAPMANNEALVALNLYAPANGEYTLSIEAQDNEKVYLLHDGTFVWDLSMSEYPITLNKGDNAGYSILVHRADAPTSVETIDGTNNQTEKLIHNGNLYILHNGKVFDAVGTMLK